MIRAKRVHYEITGKQLPANARQKLAGAFGVTTDYMAYGDIEEKEKNTLLDAELLQQFKEVEKMNDYNRLTVKKLIDAFTLSLKES